LTKKLTSARRPSPDAYERPTVQRIESFLTDVLALAGEDPDAVREGVRVAWPIARRFSGRARTTSA